MQTSTPTQTPAAEQKNDSLAIPEFYANTVALNVSPFEVELQNMLVDSERNLKGAVNIRLSPQTAWLLSRSLNRQLAHYEQEYGQIALPVELRKELE